MRNKLASVISFLLILLTFTACSKEYTLSLSVDTSGCTITSEPSGSTYTAGESITLTATAAEGYSFSSWSNADSYLTSDSSSDNNVITITMPSSDISIEANFEGDAVNIISSGATSGDGWTFFIYMAGDNTLSDYVPLDINEMEQGLYDSYSTNTSISDDVKVLVLVDQDQNNDSKLYLIQPDNNSNTINSTRITNDTYTESLELDMSDPDTVTTFLEYGLENFSSTRNALIIWNHGGGAKSTTVATASKEFCEDDSGGGYLYTNELQSALASCFTADADDPPLDFIGFDACFMGTIEEAYEFREYTKYFAASMASEWGYGWDYEEIFNNFSSSGSTPTASEMADISVKQYYLSTTDSTASSYAHSMAALDTSKLETVKSKIDSLAALVYNSGSSDYETEFESLRDDSAFVAIYSTNASYIVYYPYYDLYDFCENITNSEKFSDDVKNVATSVNTALADAVVACYGNSVNLDNTAKYDSLGWDYYNLTDSDAVRGLSILIPNGETTTITTSSGTQVKPYDYCDWYTSSEITGEEYGGLDFCTYDDDSTVETWRELFEAWYAGDEAEY
ncbi:MAG: clostripain-related cysteine peptidase [Spirochaetales bacterium]|nr:clostripain-related cysteine peptidase [Spirochaetales bacterium]